MNELHRLRHAFRTHIIQQDRIHSRIQSFPNPVKAFDLNFDFCHVRGGGSRKRNRLFDAASQLYMIVLDQHGII